MPLWILYTLYFIFFTFIAWHRFRLALALFFLLLPTYLIRFSIGPLPTTLLEIMLWIIIIIWIIKFNKNIIYHLSSIIKQNKLLSIAILLFLISATISVFTSINLRSALGEWKAFYVEPILIFFILITNYKLLITKKFVNNLLFALILSGLLTSLLAIYQHFTGWLVPYDFWQNQNTFRVTAWYGFPNAVGLFLAPLIPLSIYLITQYKLQKNIIYHLSFIVALFFVLISPLAIFFAKSTGALIGLAAGILFLLFIHKKTLWLACLISLVSIVSLVSLPSANPIKQELLFQDRSGQIRLSIWNETWQFLKDSPITGAGLASYAEKIRPYHTTVNGEGIEIFHHPHNIFLTMWINLGLLGLFAFVGILVSIFNFQFSIFKQFKKLPILNYFILSSLIIILVMGLVDSPYIKNDMAIFFWLLPALLIVSVQNDEFIPQ